jgi:cytidine deaminase
METTKTTLLGSRVLFTGLTADEQDLVRGTWAVAENAHIPRSNFPVGSTILAANERGETKIFRGCNVENRFFPPTICAERNAATTAVAEGYRKFLKVALVCKHYQGPGASPCGLCRQFLTEFGVDAVVLQVSDKDSNVQRYTVADLLPAATANAVPANELSLPMKRLVRRLHGLLGRSYVPYSKKQHAAIFIAKNDKGKTRHFAGVSDDNSSYGGSASAECVAMRTARTAGYAKSVTLAVTVDDPHGHNPVDGECLQVLREFGLDAKVCLVGPDGSVVHSSIEELLPDSFGPQALA